MDHRVGGLGRKEAASIAMLAPGAAFVMVLDVRSEICGRLLVADVQGNAERCLVPSALCLGIPSLRSP